MINRDNACTDSDPLKRCCVRLLLPDDAERSITVRPDENIWDATNSQGIVLPAICHQGRCLTCAGEMINSGEVDQSEADMYFAEDRAARFVLLCTAKPRSDLTIRTHQQDEMRAHRLALGLPAPYA
jgi:ferredoxin